MDEEPKIYFLDDNSNVVKKDQASQIRIIEYINGERFETYMVRTDNNGEEV